MVTTADVKLATKIQQLRDHGAVMSDLQRHLGPKPYLLADHIYGLQPENDGYSGGARSDANGTANDIVDERKNIAKTFDTAFADLEELKHLLFMKDTDMVIKATRVY